MRLFLVRKRFSFAPAFATIDPGTETVRHNRPVSTALTSAILAALAGGAQAADAPGDLEAQVEALEATIEQQQQQIDALVDHIESSAPATTPDAGGEGGHGGGDPAGRVHWEGYGVVNYVSRDFYQNAQDDSPEQRASTDLERIILAPTFDISDRIRFVTEIEFEHGGTGSTVEYEPEEAGEFETEIEKGGEVVLEQAHLEFAHSPAINWRVGEIMVPFGMVNTHHHPAEYFTLERSLAETRVIPATWHETGVELFGTLDRLRYRLQVVTALDSSGFSGYGFVSEGTQDALETRGADALAFVGRADYSILPGARVGASVYIGDSADNRPRRDLEEDATVTLAEVHGRYQRGPLTVRGQYLAGSIDNSDAVTRANFTSFNAGELGISKTPVGSEARSWFVEAGYDLLSLLGERDDRLDAFARFEAFDTHADTEGSISANPRYDREAATFGVNYKPRPGVVFKGEYSSREHAGDTGNTQDYYGLGLGFEF